MIKILFRRPCHVIPYLIKMNGGSTMLRALHLTVSRLRTLFQYKRNNDSVAKEKHFFSKIRKDKYSDQRSIGPTKLKFELICRTRVITNR